MNKRQGTPVTPRSQIISSTTATQDKVRVVLRVRPFIQKEDIEQFISQLDDNTIQIRKLGMVSNMKFNSLQIQSNESSNPDEEESNQIKMYNKVQDIVLNLFDGIDGTIFAYGQTGAGKTYSIVGNCPQSPETGMDFIPYIINEKRGIMIRAMEQIISLSRKKKDSRITISFFEIYNEKIYDLFTNNPKPLDLRQAKNGEITIPGLIKVQIIDIKEAISYIAEGLKNRVTSSTVGNIKSSRSHSIFQIKCQKLKIDKNTGEHDIIVSNLRIVDLAGSQKFNIPRDLPAFEREIRLTQLKCINGSLSKLGHCISALTKQNRTHIPFRDSKLTRILRQSLLGPSKILLIVCVSPSISAMNETASTLKFADSVKKAIFGRPASPTPEKKKMIQQSQYNMVIQELQKQRAARVELQRILQTIQSKPAQIELIRENDRLRQQVTMLKEELKVYQNRVKVAGLSLSKSKSITTGNKDKSPRNTKHFPPKSIGGSKKLPGTPPKTVASRSVIQFEPRNSIDINFDRESLQNQSSQHQRNLNYKNSFRENKSPLPSQQGIAKKKSFENKIKRFMEKNDDNDRQLEEKVKQRLLEIRREIVQNRDWGAGKVSADNSKTNIFEDNSTQNLWGKSSQNY